MSPDKIHDLLLEQIKDWKQTKIAWPNKSFDPAKVKEYIRPTVKLGRTEIGETCVGGVGQRSGIFYIDIFTEKNKGETRGWGLASVFEKQFHMQIIGKDNNNQHVIMNAAETENIGTEDTFQHHQFKIGFRTLVGEDH